MKHSIGDLVTYDRFGEGVIILIDGEWYGVRFFKADSGLHTLNGLLRDTTGYWLRDIDLYDEEDMYETPELNIRYTDVYAVAIEQQNRPLIYIDSVAEINNAINKDDSIIRLYKSDGFDFKIEEDSERFKIYITHDGSKEE